MISITCQGFIAGQCKVCCGAGMKSLGAVNRSIKIFHEKCGIAILVLLQFSWRRGSKDSRGQGFKARPVATR